MNLTPRFALASLLCFALSACSQEDGPTELDDELAQDDVTARRNPDAPQMNDLTMVLPLPTAKADLNYYLRADTKTSAGDTLLPQSLVETAVPESDAGRFTDPGISYKTARLVGIRFDPCFGQIGPITRTTRCENQIRLIFQALVTEGGTSQATDAAIHAFYKVSRDELRATIREVVQLRKAHRAGSLGALAPHPVVVEQGMRGAFARDLNKIILNHASGAKLTRFTVLTSGNLQTKWFFRGFDVANGRSAPMKIPHIGNPGLEVAVTSGIASSELRGRLMPETSHADNISTLLDSTASASQAKRQAAFDATLRIDNPNTHSPETIDCASCHAAQAARVRVGAARFGLSETGNRNRFEADARYVSKVAMRRTTRLSDSSGINVHMMSYRGEELFIADRVINETANTLAYLLESGILGETRP
jgi:hypothetical protein